MSLSNLPGVSEAVDKINDTIDRQTNNADKSPLSWAAVVGVLFGALLVGVFLYYSFRREKRITELETQQVVKDSTYNARLDQTRYFYETKINMKDSTINALWFRIGAQEALSR